MSTEAGPSASFFERVMQRRGVRQFVKFGIVGASGLLVNLVIFTTLQHSLSMDDQRRLFNAIFSIGFLAGGISNYVLNRIWTFRSSGHPVREGISFLTVSAAALGVALIVAHFVTPFLGPGHKTWFVSTVAAMFVNFFVNKYWTFRSVL